MTISDDPALLDFERIHRWLTTSYWSPGIDQATVRRAAANARCVGAYTANGQVGFARLITDGVTFGWLADVVVDAGVRGQGIGRAMVRHLIEAPDLVGIRRIMLNTLDAHGVYAALGFAAPLRPDFLMERLGPGAAERLRAL